MFSRGWPDNANTLALDAKKTSWVEVTDAPRRATPLALLAEKPG